jgi:mannose-6-phosphate isomerase-like protein (cupin superfamily)
MNYKVNIKAKLDLINSYWDPKLVGELNKQLVKLVKFKGEFVWHKHDNEDELFMVIKGSFKMHLKQESVIIEEGEFIIIPKGTEHKPEADEEVHVLLFEPANIINTGNTKSELTKSNLEKL